MPAKSVKQQRFMGMASTPEGRARLQREGVRLPPKNVAKEFARKPRGQKTILRSRED
jgi:hypothetical protein